MFKTLIATCLLTLGTNTQSLKAPIKNIVSFGNNISGAYCLKNTYEDLQEFFLTYDVYTNFTLTFGNDTQNYLSNPIVINEYIYYLESIQFRNEDQDESIYIYIRYNDYVSDTQQISFYLDENYTIDDIHNNFKSMYFYINNSQMLNAEQNALFNSIFTQLGNSYVTTYNGYYNLGLNTYIPVNITTLGYVNIGNQINFSMTTTNAGAVESTYFLQTYKFNTVENRYEIKVYDRPLTYLNISTNMYMSNVMMSKQSYNRLTTYGTFGYIQEQQLNADFYDLFFSLADTPLYFMFSLFNWELFGVNLFMALTGMIAFALVLVLFRKIL